MRNATDVLDRAAANWEAPEVAIKVLEVPDEAGSLDLPTCSKSTFAAAHHTHVLGVAE